MRARSRRGDWREVSGEKGRRGARAEGLPPPSTGDRIDSSIWSAFRKRWLQACSCIAHVCCTAATHPRDCVDDPGRLGASAGEERGGVTFGDANG